jgi:hypothetical protein
MGAKRWRQQHPEAFHFRKRNRRHKNDRKHYRKRLGRNRHHLTNKCRGGDFSPQNLVWLKVWKHDQWHKVFRNSDPEYVIAVLQRLCRMKGRTYETPPNPEGSAPPY